MVAQCHVVGAMFQIQKCVFHVANTRTTIQSCHCMCNYRYVVGPWRMLIGQHIILIHSTLPNPVRSLHQGCRHLSGDIAMVNMVLMCTETHMLGHVCVGECTCMYLCMYMYAFHPAF